VGKKLKLVKKMTRGKARFNNEKIKPRDLIDNYFPSSSPVFQQPFPPREKLKKLFKIQFSPLFHQIHKTNNNKKL